MSARLAAIVAVLGGLTSPARLGAADPADELAAAIDRHLAADWQARGIQPAPPADDAEFVRRVYLDLIGRAPKVAETRDFLADPAPDKRQRLVEKLMGTPSYASHFAAVTRAAWIPNSGTNPQFAGFAFQLDPWLRNHFRENTPADVLVRKLLTVTVRVNNVNANNRFVQGEANDPESQALAGFYGANEGRAENLGAAVSRLFLGIKLECAQCHDHPFAPYTKEQFWEFAAFFGEFAPLSPVRPTEAAPTEPQFRLNRLTIPNTQTQVVAKFFDGSDPKWAADRTPRQELANWLTRSDNAYFARNLANRMWAHFFGVGIIDPVDEPGENNPPTHPELLDELGKAFAAGKYDNRLLIRAITRSRAYNLTSRLTHPTQADARRFGRMNVKALTPAQLFDSLVAATGYRENPQLRQQQFAAFNPNPGNPRGQFLNRFATTEKATEASTTILQALLMMNGNFVGDQTALERSEVLAAILDVPTWDTNRRLEALFLAAFARQPTPEELERFGSYVDRGGATGDKRKALADVFWVLLNSTEFLFNH